MKKGTILILLCFFMSWTTFVSAQQFTVIQDSLLSSYKIENGKAVSIDPETTQDYAQRNTTDLLFILDKFFNTDQYRKTKSINTVQHLVNAKMFREDIFADSFLSVVYIIDIPDALTYNKKLESDTFLNVRGRVSRMPETFYIRSLNDQQVILVSIRSQMYKDYKDVVQRRKNVHAYLNWLHQKYQ